jgi:Zn-dependent alcohol dehydrogenase
MQTAQVEAGSTCVELGAGTVGLLDVRPFLSHALTLAEVNRGCELMDAQDGIRSVIRFA